MTKKYGQKPEILGEFEVPIEEMMFYMYLPIKLKNGVIKVPERLKFLMGIITEVTADFQCTYGDAIRDKYIYLTVKNIFVTPDNPGNRPGWHCDGFGTEDINYIWTNKYPTIFNIDEMELSQDCNTSMQQMVENCDPKNNISYPENTLMRLNEFNIHKSPKIEEPGIRAFVKISFSDDKYNLKGNSKNYLLDYNWKMYDRDEVRNHPSNKESDYVKEV